MGKKVGSDIKAVELFAGIGGFRIALDRLGVKTVWANDFNSVAATVYRDRFGSKEFVDGDIWKLIDETPSHDLLTGGFPCQPFSAAGKKKGIDDPRGTLFEAIVKVLQKHQPNYFILENVKRLLLMDKGKHFATILDALASLDYKIEWRVLNAASFSLPQNRQRIVITGMHKRVLDAQGVEPTSQRAIKLASSLDLDGLNDDKKNKILNYDEWQNIPDHGNLFQSWGVAYGGKYVSAQLSQFPVEQKKVMLKDVLVANADDKFDLTESTLLRLGANRMVQKFIDGVEVVSNQSGGARMGYTIFGSNGIAPTLTSSTSRHYERYFIDGKYRRLTNVEYARIQGFPDRHCSAAPFRHEYVLYGNAVPPNLVEWVAEKLLGSYDSTEIVLNERQLPLYA